MFDFLSHVIKGGLAGYAVSFQEVGRLSAKYIQRILTGVKPKDLPVQGVDKIALIINLKTAKQIGLTISPNVLARADKVIRYILDCRFSILDWIYGMNNTFWNRFLYSSS